MKLYDIIIEANVKSENILNILSITEFYEMDLKF